MKNQIDETSIIFHTLENNKNSNSISVQLKEEIKQAGYLILKEESNDSVLTKIKKDHKIKGVIIIIDTEDTNDKWQNYEKNLVLEIKKINYFLPIFLIKKNIIITLAAHAEKKISVETYCQCANKIVNLKHVILKTIENYINTHQPRHQTLPDEIPLPLSTCCAIPQKNASLIKNNTSIENEFIDYFYKKIVEDRNLTAKQKDPYFEKIKIPSPNGAKNNQHRSDYMQLNNSSGNTSLLVRSCQKIDTDNHTSYIDYFSTLRNSFGLSGLIPVEQFEIKSVLNTLTDNDQRHEEYREVCYDIMRASTSDGLIYNINRIIKKIYDAEIQRQFNEEWALFNDYHPFFNGVYSTSILSKMQSLPPLYAAKSVRYILSALSSSNTENDGRRLDIIEKPIFLIKIIINAIKFRKTILKVAHKTKENNNSDWFFNIWQPNKILFNNTATSFEDIPDEELTLDTYFWQLNPHDEWHGFENIAKDYALLDPTKITLLCPGQNVNGKMTDFGIPAMIVVRFMENKLIIPQKSGYYSFLFDVSSDSTPVKWQRIIDAMLDFKHSYDTNVSLSKLFPTLIKKSHAYTVMGLRDLCEKIHLTITSLSISALFNRALSTPKRVAKNHYHQGEKDNKKTELVSINNVINRTIAITVSNNTYNPPFLIPGEIITENNQVIIDYLLALQIFDQTFPGFEHTLQGIWRNAYGEYFVRCLIDI